MIILNMPNFVHMYSPSPDSTDNYYPLLHFGLPPHLSSTPQEISTTCIKVMEIITEK